MTERNDEQPNPFQVKAPPVMDASIHLAMPKAMQEVLESMAIDAGFRGRHPTPDYIRAILEARIEHERPVDFERIRGTA